MTKQSEILDDKNYIKLLDSGFIGLDDFMGSDEAVLQAARVSYGKGTKKTSTNRGLIRYLMRHRHTTPFEMVEFKFHVKCPIFVARQWMRHRTASYNEISARYSILESEFYFPEDNVINKQSIDNKQGRGEILKDEEKEIAKSVIRKTYNLSDDSYNFLINGNDGCEGIAKEIARIVLPVATYTEFYYKSDLKNLLHFLSLRDDSHAQHEIKVFAEAIAELIKPKIPICYEAFEDYVKKSYLLSKMEINLILDMKNSNLSYKDWVESLYEKHKTIENIAKNYNLSKREIEDFFKIF